MEEKVEINLRTAKDLRFILKQWGNMYVANDPNKKLHCEYRFVKNLDNQLKQAIKESKE